MLPVFYKQEIDNRKHQINTLKIFNDNVTEIQKDSEYEVSFQSGENNLILNVSLGQNFPKEKPILSISPSIIHPWVSDNGIVTSAPGLLNFTVHSDLGRVVQAIIRELQRNPPPLFKSINVGAPNISVLDEKKRISPSFSSNLSISPPSLDAKKSSTLNPFQRTPIILNLNNLSLKDLRLLEKSEDCQVEFLKDIAYVKDRNKILDELSDEVEELAEQNLKKEQQLKMLQEEIDFQIEEVGKLAFENERLYTVYQSFSENYSPRNIQDKLAVAAKKAEEESEKVAESFLHGDLEVEKFLNLFIKTKALCQLRKTKEEKLCHQLNRLEKAGF